MSQKPHRILIADDDLELCALLAEYLRGEGFVVSLVHDGASALARVADPATRPDLLILDVMMPGQDGLATLRELRARQALPVIMLSARGEPVDRIVGLELGADDYLAKPALPRELLARIRARLRSPAAAATVNNNEELQLGGLSIAPAQRRATLKGVELVLTGAEFSLLLALAQQVGAVVDKAVLTRAALGRELERFDRSVDVHISRLRHKLAQVSESAIAIEAVRGAGYQLIVGSP